ncbi:hypothetical protein ACQ4M4_17200 [Leptolyngbya sp. AN02str]|uniref:hypothetical protein n=1 Tax=Leptolyngbya sp. AN02str TaxID=3423363 RepID=UPI003D319038
MPSSSASHNMYPTDQAIWDSLKQAIAASSGFQRWLIEQQGDASVESVTSVDGLSLDQRVRRYLRETLETLAY